jgi:dCTP deaminase
MIQGYSKISALIRKYGLITPLSEESIQPVHIDLRLGSKIKKYTKPIDLKSDSEAEEIEITVAGYVLQPGDFILGCTLEEVNIPDGYWGFIETKGNIARAGISSHNTDGHIDPGYKGVITLEIKNQANVPVTIYPGIKFVQLFLFKIDGFSPLYKGKYQNSTSPTIFMPDE